jgi:cytochrome P450
MVPGQALDHRRLVADMVVLLAAGNDTSTHSMSNMLAMIAGHPEVERQVLP